MTYPLAFFLKVTPSKSANSMHFFGTTSLRVKKVHRLLAVQWLRQVLLYTGVLPVAVIVSKGSTPESGRMRNSPRTEVPAEKSFEMKL